MRILFVTNMLPAYPSNGAVIQTHHLMRLLSPRHEVGLWTLSDAPGAEPDLGALSDVVSFIRHVPRPTLRPRWKTLQRLAWLSGRDPMARWGYPGRKITASVQEAIDAFQPDIVQFEQLHVARPLLALAPRRKRPLLVFNAHDAIFVVLERSAEVSGPSSLVRRALNRRFQRSVRDIERRLVAAADLSLCVSDVDTHHLAPTGIKSPHVIPNGVDVEAFSPLSPPADTANPTLVFVGTLSYGPNIEAIRWYASELHPLLRARYPTLELIIVGKPGREMAPYRGVAGLEFVGFQRDIRPFFERAHLSIVPLLSGSGTRFKILEGWAMGRALVSTSIGAEGLPYRSGENMVIADTTDAFVRGVCDLLESAPLRETMARAGRQIVEREFGWPSISARHEELLLESLRKGTR